METRFRLEKYKGRATRHECPACHRKGTFTRYIDTLTGEYLNEAVGRCDREDKCGYHYKPGQYLADHPEERERLDLIRGRLEGDLCPRARRHGDRHAGSVPSPGHLPPRLSPPAGGSGTVAQEAHPPLATADPQGEPAPVSYGPRPAPCTIPREYLAKSFGAGSNLFRWICSLFDRDTKGFPTLNRIAMDYYLGQTAKGETIYWQLDGQGRIRGGKIMQYDPATGHRVKGERKGVDWVHSRMKRDGLLPQDWELSQCLFGEHLLRRRPQATVCLVESEKSALVGHGCFPDSVWLATGGKSNLSPERLRCLAGRSVVMFPDLGAYGEWKAKGEEAARSIGFSLSVSRLLEDLATGEEREEGLDIADYLSARLLAKWESLSREAGTRAGTDRPKEERPPQEPRPSMDDTAGETPDDPWPYPFDRDVFRSMERKNPCIRGFLEAFKDFVIPPDTCDAVEIQEIHVLPNQLVA